MRHPHQPHHPHRRLVVLHRLPSGEEVVVEEEHGGEAQVEAIDLPALRAATARHAMMALAALAVLGWAGQMRPGTVSMGISLASGWMGLRNIRAYLRKRKLLREAHHAVRLRTEPVPFDHPVLP